MAWRLKSCRKCRGDLALDGDEYRCWQCGTYYYPRRSEPFEMPPDPPGEDGFLEGYVQAELRLLPKMGRHGARGTNFAIEIRDRREGDWWTNNQETIRYLDEGIPAEQVARLVRRSLRMIHRVEVRLEDLRTPAGEPY